MYTFLPETYPFLYMIFTFITGSVVLRKSLNKPNYGSLFVVIILPLLLLYPMFSYWLVLTQNRKNLENGERVEEYKKKIIHSIIACLLWTFLLVIIFLISSKDNFCDGKSKWLTKFIFLITPILFISISATTIQEYKKMGTKLTNSNKRNIISLVVFSTFMAINLFNSFLVKKIDSTEYILGFPFSNICTATN